MTTIHDSLDLKKPAHLDYRLEPVADYASLPSTSSPFLYKGATIFVIAENCDYRLGTINAITTWVPNRQLFFRSTLIYNANIAGSAIGTKFYPHFNTDILDSKLIGDTSLMIQGYNSAYNGSIGAANFHLFPNSTYLIKAQLKLISPKAENFRFKILTVGSPGSESNPVAGGVISVLSDSTIAGTSFGATAPSTFYAEGILDTLSTNCTVCIELEDVGGSSFASTTMATAGSDHANSIGYLEVFKLRQLTA